MQISKGIESFCLCLDLNPILQILIVLDLAVTESAVIVVDDLFWKLLHDITFHSSHNKRHDLEVKFFKGFTLLIAEEELVFFECGKVNFKQLFIIFSEDLLSVEVPRHEEVKQSPKFYQSVLNGSSSQN